MTTRILISILSIFLLTCTPQDDIDNAEKRNENWCWFVDKVTGEGKWVPISGETNLPDGNYTLFFCNGKIRQTGKLKDKKDCDTIFYYDINEKIISKVIRLPDSTAKEFMPNGKYKSYYSTCELSGEGEVKNNKLIGTRLEYYKNGKTKLKAVIKNDTTTLLINYYESGIQMDSCLYINGKPEGLVKNWYPNGNLKSFLLYKNGLNDGVSKTYYENGQISDERNWVNGKEDGKVIGWYENGQLKETGFFANGQVTGKYLHWYDNGVKEMEIEIKDGHQEGIQKYYFDNGKIKEIRNFVNGVKFGKWKKYSEKGEVTVYNFVNGELVNEKK